MNPSMLQWASRRAHSMRLCLALSVSLVALAAPAASQETASPNADEPSTTVEQRAERFFEHFDQTSASLAFQPTGGDRPYSLVEQPLFRFSTEGNVFGSVYVWHDADDRLAVIGTVGSIPMFGVNTEFVELHLLKPKPIAPMTIHGVPEKRWEPEVDQLAFKEFANAPAVATNASRRLAQMRALARQFTAAMRHRESNHQLRLLPQPLYRYADSTRHRDGALFAFVWDNGTDPELVLRIESFQDGDDVSWRYQPIRLTWRELRLKHQDDIVWQVPEFSGRDDPTQRTPYLTGLTKPLP